MLQLGSTMDDCAYSIDGVALCVRTSGQCVSPAGANDGSTCTSSIHTTTYAQITDQFHISNIVATLGLSFFIWGLGKGIMRIMPEWIIVTKFWFLRLRSTPSRSPV